MAVDKTLKNRLEEIKKALTSFGWWPAKAGTTIHKSDVILAIDCIGEWHAEVEVLLVQDEDGEKLNTLLMTWIEKARQRLAKEPLSDYQAVWEMSEITDPNREILIIKIDSLIHKSAGDISI